MKKLMLSNSVYSKMGGLDVIGGRLINNAPDAVSGIQKAIDVKKEIKMAKKLDMYSEAVAMGTMKAKMMEKFGM